MAVRTFDGVDDWVEVALGNQAGSIGAITVATLLRPHVVNQNNYIATCGRPSANDEDFALGHDSQNPLLSTNGGTGRRTTTNPLAAGNEWYWLVVSRASGTTTPRLHVYRFSTTSWSHADGNGTNTQPSNTQTHWWIGAQIDLALNESFDGDMAAFVVWDANLSDGAIEALSALASLEALAAFATVPDEAWLFDQASPATPVRNAIPGGGAQTAINGTTVQGDNPPIPYAPAAPSGPPVGSLALLGVGR